MSTIPKSRSHLVEMTRTNFHFRNCIGLSGLSRFVRASSQCRSNHRCAPILEMALISYTMIGASLAPAILAAFFWKRVTRIAGVASIAAGMLTVTGITVLNHAFRESAEPVRILGILFPMDTDYIALPAVTVTVLTLILVSFATAKPTAADWQEFIEE